LFRIGSITKFKIRWNTTQNRQVTLMLYIKTDKFFTDNKTALLYVKFTTR